MPSFERIASFVKRADQVLEYRKVNVLSSGDSHEAEKVPNGLTVGSRRCRGAA